MANFFAKYQREEIRKLLVKFNNYAERILAVDPTADEELSKYESADRLLNEKRYFEQYFTDFDLPEAKLNPIIIRLSESAAFKELVFDEVPIIEQTIVAAEFLRIIPRSKFPIQKLANGLWQMRNDSFTLEQQIDQFMQRNQIVELKPTTDVPARSQTDLLGPTRELLQTSQIKAQPTQRTNFGLDSGLDSGNSQRRVTTSQLQTERNENLKGSSKKTNAPAANADSEFINQTESQQANAKLQERQIRTALMQQAFEASQQQVKQKKERKQKRKDRLSASQKTAIKRGGLIMGTTGVAGLIGSLPIIFDVIT